MDAAHARRSPATSQAVSLTPSGYFWRLQARWVFKSSARGARVLWRFARAEAQSELELRLAAQLSSTPEKALFLRHALDEARHARRFLELARELSRDTSADGMARPHVDSEELIERLGPTRFIAFVHFGERRGRLQFEAYAHALSKSHPRLAEAFARTAREEREHERYTRALLLEHAGEQGTARALRWVQAWEAWRRFRRAGRAFAHVSYALLMSIVYLCAWPLARWFARSRPALRGFISQR
ncbi:MAG: ferritin-like domain-containing protein [Myxococcota bacterium]